MHIYYAFLVLFFVKYYQEQQSADSKHALYYLVSKVCLPEMCHSAFCCQFLSVWVFSQHDIIIFDVSIFDVFFTIYPQSAFLSNIVKFNNFKIGLGFVSRSLQNIICFRCAVTNADVAILQQVHIQFVTKALSNLQ